MVAVQWLYLMAMKMNLRDHEHRRHRGNACKIACDVDLNVNLCVVFEKATFLANMKNKKHFLDLLKNHLSCAGWKRIRPMETQM